MIILVERVFTGTDLIYKLYPTTIGVRIVLLDDKTVIKHLHWELKIIDSLTSRLVDDQ